MTRALREAQDEISQNISLDGERFGDRLRASAERAQDGSPDGYDRLRTDQKSVNKNVLIYYGKIVVVSSLTYVAQPIIGHEVVQAYEWILLNADALLTAAQAWGDTGAGWVSQLVTYVRDTEEQMRALFGGKDKEN